MRLNTMNMGCKWSLGWTNRLVKKKMFFFLIFFFVCFFSFVDQLHNYDTNKLNAVQRCGIMCKGLYNGRSGEWCEGCCTLLVR